MSLLDITVSALGAQGDGIAESPAGRLYIAGALPGERVRVAPGGRRGDGREARLVACLDPSPDRVTPPCPHFAVCGGCAAQHLRADAYAAWKRGLVTDALSHQGLGAGVVTRLAPTPVDGRRRAELAARATAAGIVLGLHERGSRRIAGLASCLVLRPALAALLAPLKTCLRGVLPDGAKAGVLLTETETGVDIVLTMPGGPPRAEAAQALPRFAERNGVARITWRRGRADPPVLLVQHTSPRVRLGGVPVALPPGAFVQASREAEAVLVAAVMQAMGRDVRRMADLFAGLGAFALPLARAGRHVAAFDTDAAALAALAEAAGRAGLGGRVTVARRDLFRRPLRAADLAGFDGVIFDPPRAGAKSQTAQIAEARVPWVAAVSCNPATFARDARCLTEAGYRLESVVPVDQFVYSARVELVAVFTC